MASKGTQRKEGTQRKLAAILSADVAGYSLLMGADQEGKPTGGSKSGGRLDGG